MNRFTLFAALGLGALLACDGGPERSETMGPGPSKAGKAGKAGQELDELPMEGDEAGFEYSYNPIGKRDPFRSFFKTAGPEAITSPTPLQRYEVDQYALVGVVWGISTAKAMVQDPEQVGHVVEAGTYIGKNWGKVTQINSDSIVVTEEYQTIDGELVTNQIVMELPLEDVE